MRLYGVMLLSVAAGRLMPRIPRTRHLRKCGAFNVLGVELPQIRRFGDEEAAGSAEGPDADSSYAEQALAGHFPAPVGGQEQDDIQHFQSLEVDTNNEEWLVNILTSPDVQACVRLLEVSESEDVIMTMPHYDLTRRCLGVYAVPGIEKSHAARRNPFAFITIRRFLFAGGVVFANLCNNQGCSRSHKEAAIFDRHFSCPDVQDHTVEQLFGDHDPLCRCATEAIKLKWGNIGDVEETDRDEYAWATADNFAAWYAVNAQEARSASLLRHCCLELGELCGLH